MDMMKFGYHLEFNIHQTHQNHILQEIYILELEVIKNKLLVYMQMVIILMKVIELLWQFNMIQLLEKFQYLIHG